MSDTKKPRTRLSPLDRAVADAEDALARLDKQAKQAQAVLDSVDRQREKIRAFVKANKGASDAGQA